MDAPDDNAEEWPSPAERTAAIAQASALREQARNGGLRFEAFLPPNLAGWLLERIENGVFLSPSEAAFVILGEHKELEPQADLRRELLKRRVQAAIDDPRPPLSSEEIKEKMRKLYEAPHPDPATWK